MVHGNLFSECMLQLCQGLQNISPKFYQGFQSAWVKMHSQNFHKKIRVASRKHKFAPLNYQWTPHHLFRTPLLALEHPTDWSTDPHPGSLCQENWSVFFNLSGSSLPKTFFIESCFLRRFLLTNSMLACASVCKDPSTQSPTCPQLQALDGPLSPNDLTFEIPIFNLPTTRLSWMLTDFAHNGHGGSCFCAFGVVWSKQSAW